MSTDKWASWLLTRRDGGSAEVRGRHAPGLEAFRDGVLERAELEPDDVVLDVGCGTGLIAFGALERLGPGGRVIFSDISQDLLDECRRRAAEDDRCRFVLADASDLSAIEDGSVDVVTTRSVLIYSERRAEAFAEFFRVLRPGGRLSIFEPINRFSAEHRPDQLFGTPRAPEVDDLLTKVVNRFRTASDDNVLIGFDERDLLDWAHSTGFGAIELDYRAQIEAPGEPFTDWEGLKRTAPNPLAPTYGEAIEAALTPAERERLDAAMTAREGDPVRRTIAVAYLRAAKELNA
ncbi:class I SAM-dependent methyltransferase [Paractinoplanes atraurantiacus]|uniref:Methyltransferase domain-containing protein n=1 Tax=Paractinoplanes atraurantiacus TaxID=1036182 RepID=A0A285KUW8_9ACTN|nr:methyltransferase domain-containing protein [Actinoplanes atraurantiacus]SNY75186.1 Methyltransferase domain-containing protein [Actinoplanes atraurantiacus]